MCNCGGNKPKPRPYPGTSQQSGKTTQSFSLLLRDGSKQSFGSKLEADAANARAGYTGTVKPNGA